MRLIQKIYQLDFKIFGYSRNDLPEKQASKEMHLLPNDFDWKMYQSLNPDLPPELIYNERGCVRHYLEHGRFEGPHRIWKFAKPDGFEWQRYLSLHKDLPAAGIDSEKAALEHYLRYGIQEGREF